MSRLKHDSVIVFRAATGLRLALRARAREKAMSASEYLREVLLEKVGGQ